MTGRRPLGLALLAVILLPALWLVGCGGAPAPAAGPGATGLPAQDPRAQAAAEATAIIQQAQATALVLQAQAQATALVQGVLGRAGEPAPTVAHVLPAVVPTRWAPVEEPSPPPVEGAEPTAGTALTGTVELVSVGFGADGGFITVNYLAPPAAAQAFWPGVLSVTDEASGTVFEEVPVMPVIGPLIARPIEQGQAGYVMLVHVPPILRPGSLVTVDLAGYKFEHVPVQ